MPIPYGFETHRALRMQWEASTLPQREGVLAGWGLSRHASLDDLIAEVNRTSPARCGDCGAQRGAEHVEGCDQEECPTCGLQLIGCEHHR